jgi:hypothetical protein
MIGLTKGVLHAEDKLVKDPRKMFGKIIEKVDIDEMGHLLLRFSDGTYAGFFSSSYIEIAETLDELTLKFCVSADLISKWEKSVEDKAVHRMFGTSINHIK